MDNLLCIYHGGCDDGFGSAWVVNQARPGTEFFPGVYQQEPPWHLIKHRDVLFVDFSYKRPVMERIAELARVVEVLDHHKSAEEDLRPLFEAGKIWGEFDMSRSGVAITWDWFHANAPRPELLEYIQDRDLWKRELPQCDEVIAALRSYPQDFSTWDTLSVDKLKEEGVSILRYHRTLVEEALRRADDHVIDGHLVQAVNAPRYVASEVAGKLCSDDSPFAACYWRNKDGSWEFSLRSRGEFDVAKLAEKFGGGGHLKAAGFRVSKLCDVIKPS